MTGATHCSSCDAAIVWAETEAGKRIPLDAGPSPDGNVISVGHTGDLMIVKVGTAVELEHAAPDRRYQTHFATCPNANRHRRPGRKGRYSRKSRVR